MHRFRKRHGEIGEFYEDTQPRILWPTGITPLKLVTYQGRPLIPPYAREKLNKDWSDDIQTFVSMCGWNS